MLHSSHNLWGQTERQYDALGRITGAHTQYGTTAQAPERYAYDPAGNLKDPQGGCRLAACCNPGQRAKCRTTRYGCLKTSGTTTTATAD